jgi:hypothetical protein
MSSSRLLLALLAVTLCSCGRGPTDTSPEPQAKIAAPAKPRDERLAAMSDLELQSEYAQSHHTASHEILRRGDKKWIPFLHQERLRFRSLVPDRSEERADEVCAPDLWSLALVRKLEGRAHPLSLIAEFLDKDRVIRLRVANCDSEQLPFYISEPARYRWQPRSRGVHLELRDASGQVIPLSENRGQGGILPPIVDLAYGAEQSHHVVLNAYFDKLRPGRYKLAIWFRPFGGSGPFAEDDPVVLSQEVDLQLRN